MNGAGPVTVYTLGHSRHAIGTFVDLLRAHAIARVVDTRGQPWSRHNPQFNREPFRRALEAAAIAYEWRGDRLSGRPTGPGLRDANGTVRWDRVRASPDLARAIDAVVARAAAERVALICAEEDPRRCHRRFLLAAVLVERGVDVLHVRGDGHVEAESDLVAEDARGQLGLFDSPA